MRIADYQSKGLLEVPLKQDIIHVCEQTKDHYHKCRICRDIKRPGVLWKNWRGWSEEKWFNFRSKHPLAGRGSFTGLRTGIDGYHILAVDHDHRRPSITENLSFYRRRDTWINFTPSGGWHDIYLVPRRYSFSELEKARIVCGGNLLTAHDILYWIPRDPRLRRRIVAGESGPAYFAHEPTTVNGRSYFWLDEKKMNHGELEIRRLDL